MEHLQVHAAGHHADFILWCSVMPGELVFFSFGTCDDALAIGLDGAQLTTDVTGGPRIVLKIKMF